MTLSDAADARTTLRSYRAAIEDRGKLAAAVADLDGPNRVKREVVLEFVKPTLAEVAAAAPIFRDLQRQARSGTGPVETATVAAMLRLAKREGPINKFLHAKSLHACATY